MRLRLQPRELFRNAEVVCFSCSWKMCGRMGTALIRAKGSGEGEFHSKR